MMQNSIILKSIVMILLLITLILSVVSWKYYKSETELKVATSKLAKIKAENELLKTTKAELYIELFTLKRILQECKTSK